jgi:peptidoglycan/xylan/chitin deacetylase (PgdA/CDA1 family)
MQVHGVPYTRLRIMSHAFNVYSEAFDRFLAPLTRHINDAMIFAYHSVNNYQPHIYLHNVTSIAAFSRQVQIIRRNRKVVSLDTLIDRWGELQGAACLTFDDGYLDFYENVYPIISRFELPCTLFPVTMTLDTGEPKWDDKVSWIVNSCGERRIKMRLSGQELSYDTSSRKRKQYATLAIVKTLSRLGEHNRSRLVEKLERDYGEEYPEDATLTWSHLKELDTRLVSFGAHTHTHVNLAQIKTDEARAEVEKSKDLLERNLNIRCRHFAYPYGKGSSYSQEVKNILRVAGFDSAVTTILGTVRKNSDPLELRRIGVACPDKASR